MKEVRFFFDPDLKGELPKEEVQHAIKVLRLQEGDEIFLMDGKGTFSRAEITATSNHHCLYSILERMPQNRARTTHIHIAVAPTKLNDRMEWFAEKVTEIGLDEITFLDCQFSERKTIKTDRIRKIVVSAVKQSHKAWMPQVNEMTSFKNFILEQEKHDEIARFICHCYEGEKPFLLEELNNDEPTLEPREMKGTTVLIGPEGDFSVDEVKFALDHGFKSVSLGKSRLRTETAALCAVHMMQIKYGKA